MTPVCKNEECQNYKNSSKPLKLVDETWHAWIFDCKKCFSRQVKTKDKMGGVIGAGRKDKFN